MLQHLIIGCVYPGISIVIFGKNVIFSLSFTFISFLILDGLNNVDPCSQVWIRLALQGRERVGAQLAVYTRWVNLIMASLNFGIQIRIATGCQIPKVQCSKYSLESFSASLIQGQKWLYFYPALQGFS